VEISIPTNRYKEDHMIDFFINPGAIQHKVVKLMVKGHTPFAITSRPPGIPCDIPFDVIGTRNNLFSKKTIYSGIKFAKRASLQPYSQAWSLLNTQTNQTIKVDLKDLKYDKKKSTYILNRKVIKRLQKEQLQKKK
jgi:hypothetical protein